jgi:hypothetical protein
MGDVLGSFGFDLVAADVYDAVAARFPMLVPKALTDDLNIGIPPAPLQDLLALGGQAFEFIRTKSKSIAGMKLNAGKSYLLLPLQDGQQVDLTQLDPPPDFPADLKLEARGLKLGGAPIGTDEYCSEFVAKRLSELEERLTALPGINPQVGMALLRVCVASGPVYLAQVTPPLLVDGLFEEFDSKMNACALRILSLPRAAPAPACSDDRLARAHKRLQLPIRHAGAGILSIAVRHAAAYFASVASSLCTDETLQQHAAGLERFAHDTHQRLLDRVGRMTPETADIEPILQRGQDNAMLNFPLYQRLFLERKAARRENWKLQELKLQRELSRAIYGRIAEEVLAEEQTVGSKHVHADDMVYATTPGRPTFLLLAPLSNPIYRFNLGKRPAIFVAWLRRVLRIPQLPRLGNSQAHVGYDMDLESCLGTHGRSRQLDPWGNHDNASCPPTYKARFEGHTKLTRGIVRMAREAGVTAEREPKTHELLLGQFSRSQCAKLFPKTYPKAYMKRAEELVREALTFGAMQPEARRRAEDTWLDAVDALDDEAPSLRPSELAQDRNKSDRKGLRIDVQLVDDTGQELWLDGTIGHPLVGARREAEIKRTRERIHSDSKLVRSRTSVTVEKARQDKEETYLLLKLVASKQHTDGKRARMPEFYPVVLTTFGEVGPGATLVREWLCERLGRKLEREGPRADGSEPKQLLNEYRQNFNMMLAEAVAHRVGAMATSAGLPKECIGITRLPPRPSTPAPLLPTPEPAHMTRAADFLSSLTPTLSLNTTTHLRSPHTRAQVTDDAVLNISSV